MRTTFLFVLLTFQCSMFSQVDYDQQDYRQQLEIRHDNDFFVLTDQYYSSGLFISYRRQLKKGIFGAGEQLGFRLGQEIYTPSQTQSTNTDVFDRPYAGQTGLYTSWSLGKETDLLKVDMLLAVVGINSGAGGFQRWYHKAIAISDSPLWIDELEDSFHTNLHVSYVKEWEVFPNPFGMRLAVQPSLAVGSRDIFGEAEAILHLGRRNSVHKSIAYNRLGDNSREIYFAFRVAHRQVFYNGLIEGNLFGDNSPVLKESQNSLLRLGFDFNHRFDKNDYRFGLRYNSKETPDSEGHIYIQLSYAFAF